MLQIFENPKKGFVRGIARISSRVTNPNINQFDAKLGEKNGNLSTVGKNKGIDYTPLMLGTVTAHIINLPIYTLEFLRTLRTNGFRRRKIRRGAEGADEKWKKVENPLGENRKVNN